jgi:hypothetical protein
MPPTLLFCKAKKQPWDLAWSSILEPVSKTQSHVWCVSLGKGLQKIVDIIIWQHSATKQSSARHFSCFLVTVSSVPRQVCS